MHEREIDQVIATKKPIRGEVPFTGTNGRRVYDYIFVPVIGPSGEVEAIAGTTARHHRTLRCRRRFAPQRERLRAFVNATTDVAYRMNADWTEMNVSSRARTSSWIHLRQTASGSSNTFIPRTSRG